MRIAYLVNAPREHLTGAAKRALMLAVGATEAGDYAVIVAPRGSGLQRASEQRGIDFVAASFSAWGLGVGLRRALRSLDVDVAHAMSAIPAVLSRPGLLLGSSFGRGGRATFVSVVVDPDSAMVFADTRPRPLATRLRTRILARASASLDGVFAVSGAVAATLQRRGVRGVVTLGGAAVDAGALSLRAAAPLELPSGWPRIGSAIGQLEPLKGVDVLLSAFAQVIARYPDAALFVAGAGSQRAALSDLARTLKVAPHVHFLGYLEDPAPFLAALDVHVSPSLTEGLGTVTAEAMALGIPVVATDVGGVRDVVTDGETGVLVAPSDPVALADAMLRILDDDVFAHTLAENGRAHVLASHSAERFVSETRAYYDRALAARGR